MTTTHPIPDGDRVSACGRYCVAETWRAELVWVLRYIGGRPVRPWANGATIEDADTGRPLRTYGGAEMLPVGVRRQPAAS
ncbi:MAG: hypothetical protein F4Z29_00825 [Gemmatimonadetes bacterium]|nr:hypothetical protein [Gemmatimonadota bacterium]